MWKIKTIWEYVREYYVKSEVGLLGVVDTQKRQEGCATILQLQLSQEMGPKLVQILKKQPNWKGLGYSQNSTIDDYVYFFKQRLVITDDDNFTYSIFASTSFLRWEMQEVQIIVQLNLKRKLVTSLSCKFHCYGSKLG